MAHSNTAEAENKDEANTAPAGKVAAENTVTYSISPGFVALMTRLKISIAFTSYQSGKFYLLLGANPQGGLMINERLFQKAMGLCVDGNSLLLATLFQIQRFENVLDKGQFINHTYDACYVPRTTYTTGVLDAHDVGLLDDGRIIFVNTLYNCLATTSSRNSFTPLWKPPFISKIVGEVRCHLNGMAMENGRPVYVTAVSMIRTLIDRAGATAAPTAALSSMSRSGKTVCTGLSMPHSPRMFNKKLWALNSGTGELISVDVEKE